MGIMAIRAFNMLGCSAQDKVFRRVVHTGIVLYEMSIGFGQFAADVLRCHIARVAYKAVVLLDGIVHQPLMSARRVRHMAIAAAILRDRGIHRVWPWIRSRAIPLLA